MDSRILKHALCGTHLSPSLPPDAHRGCSPLYLQLESLQASGKRSALLCLGLSFAEVAAWAVQSRAETGTATLFSQSSGCWPRRRYSQMRKLTRGNRGSEFTAQQLLPAPGLSTHLPPGGCQELPDPSCGDGNELPAGRSRDAGTAERISQTPHNREGLRRELP